MPRGLRGCAPRPFGGPWPTNAVRAAPRLRAGRLSVFGRSFGARAHFSAKKGVCAFLRRDMFGKARAACYNRGRISARQRRRTFHEQGRGCIPSARRGGVYFLAHNNIICTVCTPRGEAASGSLHGPAAAFLRFFAPSVPRGRLPPAFCAAGVFLQKKRKLFRGICGGRFPRKASKMPVFCRFFARGAASAAVAKGNSAPRNR